MHRARPAWRARQRPRIHHRLHAGADPRAEGVRAQPQSGPKSPVQAHPGQARIPEHFPARPSRAALRGRRRRARSQPALDAESHSGRSGRNPQASGAPMSAYLLAQVLLAIALLLAWGLGLFRRPALAQLRAARLLLLAALLAPSFTALLPAEP